MNELDPGHLYELRNLDVPDGGQSQQVLAFVKREGPGYPGNKGHFAGTTMQEVLRAVVQRCKYVNKQIYSEETEIAQKFLEKAIWHLERRAALRHGRVPPVSEEETLYGKTCVKCGHVGCEGGCH
jgi:hypothetical protein